MKKVIKWTNKYSNETGFVQKVAVKERHFVACYDIESARKFRYEKEAANIIASLTEYGEAENNYFDIIDCE